MNFLGLGPGELALIAVLGLIVFGPQRLPEMASQLGKMVRDFRHNTADIQAEFRSAFAVDELTQARDSLSQALQETAATVQEITLAPGEAFSEAFAAEAVAEMGSWESEASGRPAESFWDWSVPEPAADASGVNGKAGVFSAWDWDSEPAEVSEAISEPHPSGAAETNGSLAEGSTAVVPAALADHEAAAGVLSSDAHPSGAERVG